jgi:phosphatidylglycerophosphate synthase
VASGSVPISPTGVAAVIVVRSTVADETFASRTLIERHRHILEESGVRRVSVTTGRGEALPPHSPLEPQLIIAAERVFDPRLYRHVLSGGVPLMLTDGGEPIGLEVVQNGLPQETQDIGSIDPYSRELRRSFRPYWMRVESIADRPTVARMLVDASGKGHQDLPAQVLNAPIEKAIARRLAETRITPNQLTLLCNVCAYGVTALFGTGHLVAGSIGAMVVGVLDGLDGRQARVQLRTSAAGRLEHLLDKVYEVAWMGALAWWFVRSTGDRRFWTALVVWVAGYILDTAAYDIFKWRRGMQLDEASPLDRGIRLVAGRRNVFSTIVLVGAVVGRAEASYLVTVVWSVVTAVVHWARVAVLLGRPPTTSR